MERADGSERRFHARPDRGRRSTQILEAEGDLVSNDAEDDLILWVLEDARHGAGELSRASRPGVEPRDRHAPGEASSMEVGDQPGQGTHQSRLPRAGRSEKCDDLSLCELERDFAQSRRSPARIRVRDPFERG